MLDNGYANGIARYKSAQFTDAELGGWDVDILNDICNERDRNLIQQISISVRSKEDSWFWMLEDKGNFTVRSCYRKLRGEVTCLDGDFLEKVTEHKASW